jgi:hypothetical protein
MYPWLCAHSRILVVVGIILLLIVGIPLIFLNMVFSSIAEHGFIIPQDCNGTNVHLSGTVHGVSVAALEVKGGDSFQGESGIVTVNLVTDEHGKFDSGSTTIPIFVCAPLVVSVSAQGFETKQIMYWVQEHFSEDELGASMQKGHTLPLVLDIQLERL